VASIERVQRLLNLVGLLQSGRNFNSAQLADICQVSRRTVFRDIKTLQESGVSVSFDEEKQGYSLPQTSFLPPAELTLEETISLLLLCHELGGQTGGVPFQHPARSAALKLLSNLPRHLRDYVGELTASMAVGPNPHNPLDEAKPFYQQLLDALAEDRQIRIGYDSLFEQKEISTLLSPYRVFFHRRSWYVVGRSSLHRAVRTFNVGRILKAETLDSTYETPPRFSLDRHFGNAWSMIREPGERHDVIVRFQSLVARNVAEINWHKTQNTVWNDDGTLDFQVTVDGLGEIMWWILGYGKHAEVIRPTALRKRIQEQISAMQKTYAGKTPKAETKTRKRKP
jgi:predicted DNA-binding transcriptional regulator YafY